MKLTLAIVIVALCLVAVKANVSVESDSSSLQDEIDVPEYIPEDFAKENDIEEFSFFGSIFHGMFWVLRAALRTLKGVFCSVQGVLNIRMAAQKFIDDVNACGGVVSKQVQSVIKACQNVITTANAIIALNDDACKAGEYNEETDSNKKTPFFKCFLKMMKKMLTLNGQIKKAISLIKKVPKASDAAGVCVKHALTNLESTFTKFPSFVKQCSKLTH